MIVGVPTEIKNNENRVGLIPSSVSELTNLGHKVLVQSSAGKGIGVSDDQYKSAGASIVKNSKEIFANSKLIVKVKEPQKIEWEQLNPSHIIFTYLHLAADYNQIIGLLKSGCTAIAYETILDKSGSLPLLTPMSEVAGRLAVIEAAHHLKSHNGGNGLLISGVPGTNPANVLIIGAGVVGSNATKLAVGMGAKVTVVDKSLSKLRVLSDIYGNKITTVYSSKETISNLIINADIVIGAVLIPGATTPKLLSRSDLLTMKKGSIIVDVSIDQGGCFETSKATTHESPTYEIDGILHYCVANMPGAVPKTSTDALNNATLPYVLDLAQNELFALEKNKFFSSGLNIRGGEIICKAVKEAFNNKKVKHS